MRILISISILLMILAQTRGLDDEYQFEFTISHIHKLLQNDSVTCERIIDYFLRRAYTFNPLLNAIVLFNPNAKAEAIKLDDIYREKGQFVGRLHCVPTLVKDNIDVEGLPTTGGVKLLRHSIPNANAVVVERFKKEGAIILAKTNMARLAHANDNSETGGLCNNPHDLSRTCGGSSTGTGAGIAAGMALIGLGTDTHGSIINPASFNGLFGLRSGLNTTLMKGIIPLFEKRDVVAPVAKHLDDLLLAYSVMNDDASILDQFARSSSESNLTLGIISNFVNSFRLPELNISYLVEQEVRDVFDQTRRSFEKLNVNVRQFTLKEKTFAKLNRLFKMMFTNDCYFSHLKVSYDRYFTDRNRFGTDSPYHSYYELAAGDRVGLMSNFTLDFFRQVNASYAKDQTLNQCRLYDQMKDYVIRLLLKSDELPEYDALLMPSWIILPYLHGKHFADDEYVNVIELSAYTGFPALNLPGAYSTPTEAAPNGLPIGMSLISKPDRLFRTLRIAKMFESSEYFPRLNVPFYTPILDKIDRSKGAQSIDVKKTQNTTETSGAFFNKPFKSYFEKFFKFFKKLFN